MRITLGIALGVLATGVVVAQEKPSKPLLGQPSSLPGAAKGSAPSTPPAPPGGAPFGAAGGPQGLPGQRLPGSPVAPAPSSPQTPLASSATTQAVNPEVLALKTASDLVARDLGFNSAGEITFNLVNRGEVGVNVPTKPGAAMLKSAQAPASGSPIAIDIYVGTTKMMSVQQPSMGGKQTKNLVVKLLNTYPTPKCLETRNLKVVIDPQNHIKELHDDNNVTEAPNSARPCPDLAIKSIKRDYDGPLNLTYRVKVTVVNQGNAPSPSNVVWATSLPGGVWPVTGWPELVPTTTLKALAPGEDTSFKVGGSVVSANKTAVRIVLDRDRKVEESDEGNNFKDDRL